MAEVSDFILERLSEWGVRRIFAYPGDGISGLMGAMGRNPKRFDLIRVRHEEMAAFMACGHAKFTGEVGVCLATSGPGALHLLAGLYDAKCDHAPVVAIVGQQKSVSLGSDFQQEVNLQSVFEDVASYVETIVNPAQARHVMLGFRGIRVDNPDQIYSAWEQAFAADRPVVIEFITDPDVPPIPPHVTLDQVKSLLGTLSKVDPDQWGIIKHIGSDS